MSKKVYCPVCQEQVTFYILESEVTYIIDNTNITFNEKIAKCNKCNEPLFVDEIEKENQIRFDEELVRQGIIKEVRK